MAKPSFMVDPLAPPAPKAPPRLQGFADEALHPNTVEALKVWAEAQAVHAHRKRTIDGQYLKMLDALGTACAAQAEAVRALMAKG